MAIPGLTGDLPAGTTFDTSAQNPGLNAPNTSTPATNNNDWFNSVFGFNPNNFSSSTTQNVPSAYQSTIDNLTAQIKALTAPIPQPQVAKSNVFDYVPPDYSKLVTAALNDPKLVKYYSDLLAQNQGDVNLAKQRLSEDYNTGQRYATQGYGYQSTRAQEDFQSAMSNLGIQFPKEQQSLQDTLNKRGIALTQTNPGESGTTYAGGGRAGYELGQLNEDQQLRQEAVQRTQQRGLQDIALSKAQTLGDPSTGDIGSLARAQVRGTEDVTQKQRDYQQQLESQKEDKASQMANIQLQSQLGNAQLKAMGGTPLTNI